MAERRMLTKKVTDDDNFMSLSSSAQALYLHLSMSADDDGFCNQVSLSMFKAHASVQDLEALLEKRFIYQFENGVIVIKHWRMANALRKDRYTPTSFQDELHQLGIKKNGSYTWLPNGCQMVAEGLPQDSIGKVSLGKVNNNGRFKPPTLEEVKLYCSERSNKIDPEYFLDYYETRGWKLSKGQPMKDWKAAVRTWERNNFEKTKENAKTTFASYPQREEKTDLKGFKISKTKVDPEEIRKRLNNH